MKNIVLFLLIALLPIGCKTPAKVASTTKVEVTDKTKFDVEERHEKTEQSTVTTITQTGEGSTTVEETTTTHYDTDKPVDATTGKPPVKSETATKKTTTTGRQTNEQKQAITASAESNELKDKTKKDVEADTESTYVEKPQTPKVAYVCYIVITIGVVLVGYWLNRKFKWLNKLLGK